jgi:hypothetical protein
MSAYYYNGWGEAGQAGCASLNLITEPQLLPPYPLAVIITFIISPRLLYLLQHCSSNRGTPFAKVDLPLLALWVLGPVVAPGFTRVWLTYIARSQALEREPRD